MKTSSSRTRWGSNWKPKLTISNRFFASYMDIISNRVINLDKYKESVTEGTYGSLEAKYD